MDELSRRPLSSALLDELQCQDDAPAPVRAAREAGATGADAWVPVRAWIEAQPAPAGLYATRDDAAEAARRAARRADPPAEISGAVVRETRDALGMSRRELAEALGYTGKPANNHKAIQLVEEGKRGFGAAVAERFVTLRAQAGLKALDGEAGKTAR